MDKPSALKQEHLEFLDALRASGKTNMFAATHYLKRAFPLKPHDATKILAYWMETFGERMEPKQPHQACGKHGKQFCDVCHAPYREAQS